MSKHTVQFITVTKYLLLNEYIVEFPFKVFPARQGVWSLISGLFKFETMNGLSNLPYENTEIYYDRHLLSAWKETL